MPLAQNAPGRGAEYGLAADDPRWREMFENRNRTVHTRYEKFAEKVYGRLPQYVEILVALSEKRAIKQ